MGHAWSGGYWLGSFADPNGLRPGDYAVAEDWFDDVQAMGAAFASL
jgi:hypothetical protein